MRQFSKLPAFIAAASWLLLLALTGACLLIRSGLQDTLGPADVGLVFGSKVERDGRPSQRLQARLERARELYRQGCFPVVIVSGGLGKEGYDEATVMRDYLVARGIPPERVIVDSNGSTTLATARNADRILREHEWGSVLVVTQYFHVPRAKWTLQRMGIRRVYSAHARYWELRDLYSVLREMAAFARYWLILRNSCQPPV